MKLKVAVFMNEENKVESFVKGKCLAVFAKKEEGWQLDRSINLEDCTSFGLVEMRKYFSNLIHHIPDVKVVAAKEAYGIPYSIFYSEDFSIWEMEGDPHGFLDYIMSKEIEHEELEENKKEEEAIVEVDHGKYFIDLIKLQNSNGISSKQAIIPFLKSKDYDTLEIKCCHIPPWINRESKELKFEVETQKIEKDMYKVILRSIK